MKDGHAKKVEDARKDGGDRPAVADELKAVMDEAREFLGDDAPGAPTDGEGDGDGTRPGAEENKGRTREKNARRKAVSRAQLGLGATREPNGRVTKATWALVKADYLTGKWSSGELGKKYGINPNNIRARASIQGWNNKRAEVVAVQKVSEERAAAVKDMELPALIDEKRVAITRKLILVGEKLLNQIDKNADSVGANDTYALAQMVKTLRDLIEAMNKPLQFDKDKGKPPGVKVNVNILQAVTSGRPQAEEALNPAGAIEVKVTGDGVKEEAKDDPALRDRIS